MSDSDNISSAPGSPAGSLPAPPEGSSKDAVSGLVLADAPSPTPAPTTEQSASHSSSPAESSEGQQKGKGQTELSTIDSRHQPRGPESSSGSGVPRIMSRSLTMESGSKRPLNLTEQVFGPIKPPPKTTYLSRNKRSPSTRIGPKMASDGPREGIAYSSGEIIVPAYHSENPPKLPRTPRHAPLHKASVQDTPHRHGSDSYITEKVEQLQVALGLELDGAWMEDDGKISEAFGKAPDMPDWSNIGQFLQYHRDYDHRNNRWMGIPEKALAEDVAAIIEVKTEDGLDLVNDEKQLAVYAREIFVQQPNRRFVYCLLLTEKRVRVYQFDRGGVLYSNWYNIHSSAITFVQIILGIASKDESRLGLDKRIFWEGEERYFADPEAEEVRRYRIINPENPFRRRTIRGRGTTCWTVMDEFGNTYVLKFSWKTLGREGEWEHLKRIKDANPPLKHVGTMESFRLIEKVSSLRHGILLQAKKNFADREYYYTLQQFYGPPLEKFRSVLQLYRAFRDSVSASMELLSIGILHRDISLRNILLDARQGKGGGGWGILIDFDMAIFLGQQRDKVKTDFRTGTRAFQSYKVLHNLGSHDFLDELESCFYVFSYLFFAFHGPRKHVSRLPDFLRSWESGLVDVAKNSKRVFLQNASLGMDMPGWPMSAQLLFDDLRSFLASVAIPRVDYLVAQARLPKMSENARKVFERRSEEVLTKSLSSVSLPDVDPAGCNDWLTVDAKKHYMKVLELIDAAIESELLEADGSGLALASIEETEEYTDSESYSAHEEPGDADNRASPVPEQQYHDPLAQPGADLYSAPYSHDSVSSKKRSASESQESDEAAEQSTKERGPKRAKGSHSESRDG
ncbi:hypothetical protein OE88DRAFT_1736914 [Heliocybe sulcata]|uniref:Fungal-type protein kinase domain-containing protein n=1 Tax=Heliocybe sulcata TaxID=5364 RepID=A0A5C3MZR0_9AGAM|nr:hypothetical protein OE88DRAFT_1736914 [Heliocybe sulcata]